MSVGGSFPAFFRAVFRGYTLLDIVKYRGDSWSGFVGSLKGDSIPCDLPGVKMIGKDSVDASPLKRIPSLSTVSHGVYRSGNAGHVSATVVGLKYIFHDGIGILINEEGFPIAHSLIA